MVWVDGFVFVVRGVLSPAGLLLNFMLCSSSMVSLMSGMLGVFLTGLSLLVFAVEAAGDLVDFGGVGARFLDGDFEVGFFDEGGIGDLKYDMSFSSRGDSAVSLSLVSIRLNTLCTNEFTSEDTYPPVDIFLSLCSTGFMLASGVEAVLTALRFCTLFFATGLSSTVYSLLSDVWLPKSLSESTNSSKSSSIGTFLLFNFSIFLVPKPGFL